MRSDRKKDFERENCRNRKHRPNAQAPKDFTEEVDRNILDRSTSCACAGERTDEKDKRETLEICQSSETVKRSKFLVVELIAGYCMRGGRLVETHTFSSSSVSSAG